MCWKCGKITIIDRIVSFSEVCPNCGADIHCCKNCMFYEKGSHYDCHETIDELVKDKERANFCDYFKLQTNIDTDNSGKFFKKTEEAKKTFNSLFGD
jgi:predicted RNA-binding Zn-ribbon protein involved in translation (DUF1610 family)